MRKKKKQVRAYSLGGLLFVLLLVVIIALLVGGIITIPKLQDGIFKTYRAAGAMPTSGVLSDLSKDIAFDSAEYPEDVEDYAVSVIQIAESKDGALIVFAYQPSGKGTGSSINISRFKSDSETQDFKNYTLELLDSDGVFFKYRVKGFELSTDIVRYYNISSILRKYIDGVDTPPQGEQQTVSEVPYSVGWCYSAATFNGELYYGKEKAETMEVVVKLVGYVRYKDGGLFPIAIENDTDLFFVAFKTDQKIDELKSVKIGWNYVGYKYTSYGGGYIDGIYYPPTSNTQEQSRGAEEQTISAKDEMFNYADGLFGRRFSWDAIQTTTDYIAKQNNDYYLLDDDADLTATDWVVSFAKYKFVETNFNEHFSRTYTQVSDVILLQLNFINNGRAYNLGVVDNKQTGGDDPFNTPKEVPWYVRLWDAVCWLFAKVWSIIAAPLTWFWNRYKPWIITAICVICGIALLSFIVSLFKK